MHVSPTVLCRSIRASHRLSCLHTVTSILSWRHARVRPKGLPTVRATMVSTFQRYASQPSETHYLYHHEAFSRRRKVASGRVAAAAAISKPSARLSPLQLHSYLREHLFLPTPLAEVSVEKHKIFDSVSIECGYVFKLPFVLLPTAALCRARHPRPPQLPQTAFPSIQKWTWR